MIDVELAWAAGVFEGEGSVRINTPTKRNRGTMLVDMVNTDVEIVAFFQARWPGYMRQVRADGKRRSYYRYRVAAGVAARLINDLLPYVHTRRVRERMLLALEFQAQKSSSPRVNTTADYIARQTGYYEQMAVLNRRGVPDALGGDLSPRPSREG